MLTTSACGKRTELGLKYFWLRRSSAENRYDGSREWLLSFWKPFLPELTTAYFRVPAIPGQITVQEGWLQEGKRCWEWGLLSSWGGRCLAAAMGGSINFCYPGVCLGNTATGSAQQHGRLQHSGRHQEEVWCIPLIPQVFQRSKIRLPLLFSCLMLPKRTSSASAVPLYSIQKHPSICLFLHFFLDYAFVIPCLGELLVYIKGVFHSAKCKKWWGSKGKLKQDKD